MPPNKLVLRDIYTVNVKLVLTVLVKILLLGQLLTLQSFDLSLRFGVYILVLDLLALFESGTTSFVGLLNGFHNLLILSIEGIKLVLVNIFQFCPLNPLSLG